MRRRAAHEEMLGHEELEPQLPSKEEREVARKARTYALRKAKWERMLAAVRCPDDRAESSSSSCNSSGRHRLLLRTLMSEARVGHRLCRFKLK